MGLLQDLSDIVELNVFVFVHGSVPDAGRESAHSKKRKLTQIRLDAAIRETISICSSNFLSVTIPPCHEKHLQLVRAGFQSALAESASRMSIDDE
jgi:hypothetical protein